jgi:tRNA dimethylallyltransferase
MDLSLERLGRARAVLIAGPTASGKSALAMRLAEAAARAGRHTLIVNADAMQVYDALRVVTARPGPEEEAKAAHRLYGHIHAAQPYSVGAWLADLGAVLEEADRTGALVIAAGGTGLYFKALTEGIAEIPRIPAELRAGTRRRLENEGIAALYSDLAARDPATAESIRAGDAQRIVRALEVLEATGEGLSAWHERARRPPLIAPEGAVRLVVDIDRPLLHSRVEARFERMVEEGALEEVAALLSRRLDPGLPVMKAIGVRQLGAFLRGEAALEAAIADAKTETRRYAKRQTTWFRNQMPDWTRVRA